MGEAVARLSGHMLHVDPGGRAATLAWDVRVGSFDVTGGAHAGGLNPAFAARWEAAYANGPDTMFETGSRALRRWIAAEFQGVDAPSFQQAGANGGRLVMTSLEGRSLEFGSRADYLTFLADAARSPDGFVQRLCAVVGRLDAGLAVPSDLLEAEYARSRARQETRWAAERGAMAEDELRVILSAEEAGVSLRPDADGDWWVLDEGEEQGPYGSEHEAASCFCVENGLGPARHAP